jgi:hypothetical protein
MNHADIKIASALRRAARHEGQSGSAHQNTRLNLSQATLIVRNCKRFVMLSLYVRVVASTGPCNSGPSLRLMIKNTSFSRCGYCLASS